jgi:flagellar hook assembly protein FlgD
MKRFKILLVGVVLFLSLPQTDLFANIFAAHVQLDFDGNFPATIRYRLNEDATSVTIYLKMDNVIIRTLSGSGDQLTAGHEASITWDGLLDNGGLGSNGVYTVEIEAASDGHADWTLLSDRTGIETKMTNVRGVAANKNNGSVNFGRIYVLQQQTRLAGEGIFRPRGIWLYKNDLSFWGGSQETAYASGNFYQSLSEYCDVSVWGSWFDTETMESITDYEDSNGPFRVTVDQADYVYVSTSLVDALGGVTVGDPEFSKESVFFLLNRLPFTGYGQDPNTLRYCTFEENIWTTDSLDVFQTYGVTRNHGLCSGMWIDGVGADRVLYVCDALNGQGYMDETWGQQQVVKFPVGDYVEQGLTYTENPEVVLPNSLAPEATEIQFDENGNLFVGGAYNRAQGVSEYHSLQKFHPEGDSYVLDWERIILNTIQTMGIAYDPRSNRLAVSDLETLGYIRIFNTETGELDDEFSTWDYALRNNDLDFDAAGNIIGANQTIGQVICLSPPDGPNSFVTKSGYCFKVGEGAGVFITSVESQKTSQKLDNFTLEQNYPNPFNPTTRINYSLSKPENVNLKIYNNTGQLIKVLVNQFQNNGEYSVEWNAKDARDKSVTSGLYFYQLQAGSFCHIQKMILLK